MRKEQRMKAHNKERNKGGRNTRKEKEQTSTGTGRK
jgi:hypothetical protein